MTQFLRKKGARESEIFICKTLLDHILKKNYFTFNDEMYLQISGTAMGTRCHLNYGIAFMAELEENFLKSVQLKPRLWKRFIDDIFIIWSHGEEKLKEFLDEPNSFHNSIKFTEQHSTYGIPFLDTFTYIEDNTLKTRVYHKPTDNKQYLHYTSCHPLQPKNAIPYSLLVQAKRICTKESEFVLESKTSINKLRERKYPESILERATTKILQITREQLMEPRPKEEDNRI